VPAAEPLPVVPAAEPLAAVPAPAVASTTPAAATDVSPRASSPSSVATVMQAGAATPSPAPMAAVVATATVPARVDFDSLSIDGRHSVLSGPTGSKVAAAAVGLSYVDGGGMASLRFDDDDRDSIDSDDA
jgi:hypothetical protein